MEINACHIQFVDRWIFYSNQHPPPPPPLEMTMTLPSSFLPASVNGSRIIVMITITDNALRARVSNPDIDVEFFVRVAYFGIEELMEWY